jgi:pimeloyl-ACP methyl ester carboxylesterase
MATTTTLQVQFRNVDGVRIRWAGSWPSSSPRLIWAGFTSSRPTWADYLACYDGDRFAESMRYVRRYPEELPVLAELLPQIATPVTIINGRHDRVVPLANAEFLDERLPNSRLEVMDAGHFIWEEKPGEYASFVLDAIAR